MDSVICRELTVDEIKYIVKKFGESAAIAKRAGFDGIEIHAVHEGYLIDQFAISLFNHRTDEYGGSLENRLRFAIEILQEIKRTCGPEYPVILRYSPKSFIKDLRVGGLPGETFVEKGRDIEEGMEVIKLLEKAGYDAFDVDVGSYDAWYWSHPPMYQDKGLYLKYAEMCKNAVNKPIITAGRMDNPDLASNAVTMGMTDMVSLGRPLLADPFIVEKIAKNQIQKIRPCLSCQEGCMGRLQEYCSLSCAVNPACGRENEMLVAPASTKKRIVVVGGGIAGCEAARVLALRGHKVSLFEKSQELGGNLIPGGAPDFKEDDHALVAWYKQELETLKVNIRYNIEVYTGNGKGVFKPMPLLLQQDRYLKVIDLGNRNIVYTAEEVLLGKKEAGEKTVIIGGGLVGCELALMLSRQGKKVIIIESMPEILNAGAPLCQANSAMLQDLMPFNHIEVRTMTKVLKVIDKKIVITKEGVKEELPVDSVILAIGYNSNNSLYDQIKDSVDNVYLLGDARHVSNIMYAIWDAFELSRTL